MNLLVLMYHRACPGRHGNSPAMLDAHFAHIATSYANVMPGEALSPDRLNVCLTFDDAYFDFYARVFPLLVRHNLRALLAVPPMYVQETVHAAREARLNLSADESFANPSNGGFCTWPELEEMALSRHVVLAAHGFSHQPLDSEDANLSVEIDSPQSILSARFGQQVTSFVFPYGRYSRTVLRRVRERYRHALRIGGAINRNWEGSVTYRVDADEMETPVGLFAPKRLRTYRARFVWNRLRGR